MVDPDYCPDPGDIVWLDFNPQKGHEQMSRRPAIVLSPLKYNKKIGLALFCPITSQIKDYPFEVKLPSQSKIQGVIISDQVKSLDWKIRNIEFIEKANYVIITKTILKLSSILN